MRVGLDGDTVVKLIIPQFERSLGTRISYTSANLTWLSSNYIRISIVGISCQKVENQRFALRIPKTVLDIKLLPLIKRTVLVERAVLSKPTLLIRLPQRRPTARNRQKKQPSIHAPRITVYPVVKNLTVKSASIQVEKLGSKGKSFHLLFENIGMLANDVVLTRVKSIKVQGLISSPVRAGFLKINYHSIAKVSQFEHTLHATLAGCPTRTLRIFADLLGLRFPIDGGTSDIVLSMHGSSNNLIMKGEVRLSNIHFMPGRYFHRKAMVNVAGLKFEAKVTADTIHFDLPGISLPGLNLSAKADIQQWSGKQPIASINIKAAAVELEKVFPYLPLNLLKPMDRNKLLKAGLTGRLTITNGSWSGKLNQLISGKITEGITGLDIFLENVSGFLPGPNLPIKDASGKLRMNANEILFQKVDLILATSPIVLNGSIHNLKTTPRIDLFVSLKAEAEDLHPLLSYRFIPKRISSWLGLIQNPTGQVDVKLNIKGKSNDLNMQGNASLKNINCKIDSLSLPVKQFNGLLTFKGPRITIAQLTGNIGDTATSIKGHIVRGMLHLDIQAKVVIEDLRKLHALPPILKLSGTSPLKLTLEGKFPEISLPK